MSALDRLGSAIGVVRQRGEERFSEQSGGGHRRLVPRLRRRAQHSQGISDRRPTTRLADAVHVCDDAFRGPILPVAVYEDAEHRRFIDVEGDHEPIVGGGVAGGDARSDGPTPVMYQGRRAQIADLIAAGLVEVGESLEFPRPRRGELVRATVLADGTIQTEDGQIWPSPSRAAMSAADVPSYDGWHAWRLPRLGGIKLDHLRQRLVADAVEPFTA